MPATNIAEQGEFAAGFRYDPGRVTGVRGQVSGEPGRYSGKIVFQSFFMSTTVQPFSAASARPLSRRPMWDSPS